MEFVSDYASPLGRLWLTGSEAVLTGLAFEGQRFFDTDPVAARPPGEPGAIRAAKAWLDRYFAGETPGEPPPLHYAASAFRQAVWTELREIPYGRTVTYGALAARVAERLGVPRLSPRAVGGAVGHNPIAILIPCHRVIGADGSLTGYAGGIGRKAQLLSLEGIDYRSPVSSGRDRPKDAGKAPAPSVPRTTMEPYQRR